MTEYEIYAISYARNDTRTRSENFLDGDLHDVPMPMSFYVWAIVGNGRTYLLDTGFDTTAGQARGRVVDRPIDVGLKAIGINADMVDEVILSHLHWDHAGNHTMFPRARYHVQDTEMAY